MDFEEGSAFQMGLMDFEAGRSFLPLSLGANLLPISSNFNQSTNLSFKSSKFYPHVDSKFDTGSTLSPHSVSSAGLPPSDFSTSFDFDKTSKFDFDKTLTSAPFHPGKPADQFQPITSSFGEISRPSGTSNLTSRNISTFSNGYQPNFPRPFPSQAKLLEVQAQARLNEARSGRESSLSSSSLNNLDDVMEDTTVVYVSGADVDDSREGVHFGLQLCQGACCPGRVKFAWMVEDFDTTRGRVGSVSSDGYSTPGSSRESRDGGYSHKPAGNSKEIMSNNGPAGASMEGMPSNSPAGASMEGMSNYKQAGRGEIIRKDNGTLIIPSAMPGLVPRTPPRNTLEPSGFCSSDANFLPPPPPTKSHGNSLLDRSIEEDESDISGIKAANPNNPNKWAKIKRKNKKFKK